MRTPLRLLALTLLSLPAVPADGSSPPPAGAETPGVASCARRVAFVLEPGGLEALRAILDAHEERLRESGYLRPGRPGVRELPRLLLRLGPGHCADLVWPRTAEAGAAPGAGHVLLASSPWYELGPRETLSEVLVGIGPPVPAPRLADAVAVAAAGGGERPAAVVLVTAAGAEDGSRLGEGEVAAMLEGLRVPLLVWTLVGGTGSPPGRGEDAEDVLEGARDRWGGDGVETAVIGGWDDLERAVGRLRTLAEGAR